MSATDAAAPDGAPLSIDQAVELMTGRADEDEVFEEAPSEDGADAPEAGPADDEEDDEAPLDPPHFWSAEDRAAFEALPRHLQETVLAYERNRDGATARKIQEAAEARNRAEQAAQAAGEAIERLDALLPEAEAAFGRTWPEGMDWGALADEVGAEQAMRLKLQRDQDAENLQRMRAAKQEADEAAFRSRTASEYEKLKTVQPDLADPKHGAERRQDVVKFLADNGVPLEAIKGAGAVEFALAYDALRYRRAKESFRQGRDAPSVRPNVAPGAAPARSATQLRQAGAKARFAEKPTVDNAVAALLARG